MFETAAFPQHGWTSDPATIARMATRQGMTMRQYYKAAALQGFALKDDGRYSKGQVERGEDKMEAKWVAGACGRYADALLAEDAEFAKREGK